MRQVIALAACSIGLLTCGAQQSDAQFYGYYSTYYRPASCCYGPSYYAPYTSYYAPRVSYYVSTAASCCPTSAYYPPVSSCCPTTSCYQPPVTSCCQQPCCPSTNCCQQSCCPSSCGSGCATGACGAGGCAAQPSPITAALPPQNSRPVRAYTHARVLPSVRTAEFVSTEAPEKPIVQRATLRSTARQTAPSSGWEAIN